jgi:hypothetical protein
MFKKTPKEPSDLDKAIAEILREMTHAPGDSKQYKKLQEQLTALYALRKIDADIATPMKWRPEFLVPAIASVVGILVIVGYEQMNVVTTKALGLLTKPS